MEKIVIDEKYSFVLGRVGDPIDITLHNESGEPWHTATLIRDGVQVAVIAAEDEGLPKAWIMGFELAAKVGRI